MIYTGSNEILGIKLGNTDISAIYAGDLLIYPTTVTAWSVTPTQIEMVSTGGTERIKIASLSAWTITSSESWVTFSQNSGDSGRTTVIATIAANMSPARTATITVTDGTNTTSISVAQAGLSFSVSPASIEVLSAATTQDITISSPYPWTIVSSESWITFSQDSGSNGTYTVTAYIDSTVANRTATITVDNGYEYSAISVSQSLCNPLIIAQHSGNTNNQGVSFGNNFYLFDSGITRITPCKFDFTGIKSICHRRDGSFAEKYPAASIGNGTTGCLQTIEYFEADCSTVEVLHYCFGNDREAAVSQTLTSVTLYNTDKVKHIGDFCYYNSNLKEVHLGNLSAVTNFESNCFNASNVSLTGFTVERLPNMNLNVGWQYCPLSVDSLVNIFNALPTASGSRTVTIGTTNKNKLSAAQLAIATNKGWTVN
jgi:hypothetical protein